MKEESIVKEALEKYPVFEGFTSKGLSHDIYSGQKYKREGYIAGRSKGIEREKELKDKLETLFMLCEENGKPVDGFRFRELILELKQLINK